VWKLIVALACGFAAGAASAQTVSGTVYEGSAPARDAFVIVHWTGQRPGFFHYESVCLQAALAKTDERGRFEIKEPPPLRSTFLVWRREPSVAVWKPGFDTRSRGKTEWTLAPTTRSREERVLLAEIIGNYGCSDGEGGLVPLVDANGALADFRKALAAELPPKPSTQPQIQVLPRGGPGPASR
jgi:hypothetical protein